MSVPVLIANRLRPVSIPEISLDATWKAMAAPAGHRIGIPCVRQVGTFWCWAAVSVGMRSFVRKDLPPMSQCDLARLHLTHAQQCCANNKALPACDQQSVLEAALLTAGVIVKPPKDPISFPEMRQELMANPNRPVCAMIRFPSSPNHFVQIDGFKLPGPVYIINDPQRDVLEISENELMNNYHNEGGRWRASYLLA